MFNELKFVSTIGGNRKCCGVVASVCFSIILKPGMIRKQDINVFFSCEFLSSKIIAI